MDRSEEKPLYILTTEHKCQHAEPEKKQERLFKISD